MRQIIICVAVAIVIFCIIVEKRMIDHRRKQIEFDYISWIEVGGLDSARCESLFDYICTAQKEMEIPVQYCVLAKDEENVRLIIKKFQQDISTRFFARKLSLGNPNHKIKAKDMFFYLLFMYLEEHECDYSFADNIMHRQISKKSYGSWGGELYDSENELTDFGASYEKLHYVTSEYCYRHVEMRKTFSIRQCEYLRTQIDEKRISISRM